MSRVSKAKRDKVSQLLGTGLTDAIVAEAAGLTRETVNRWKNHGVPVYRQLARSPDVRHLAGWRPIDSAAYCYLLGLHLGDGSISRHGATCFGLRITLDDCYPEIIESCVAAIRATTPAHVGRYQRHNDHGINLTAYSPIWPFAFPQHGPGKKHLREIALEPWQEDLIATDPRPLLQGLVHSDGCRCINRFSVELKDGPREYEYPRYFFTNYSADIRGIFCRYCDQLGVRWSQSSFKNISVSHRKSVAILDSFIGPKR